VKLKFVGAAGEVTGSMHLLETPSGRLASTPSNPWPNSFVKISFA